MRILLLNKYAHVTGGADSHVLTIAEQLSKRGHDVALLSTGGARDGAIAGWFVPLLVTHASGGDLTTGERARVAASALWNRTAAAAADDAIRRFRPDVVHAHKLYPQLSVAPVVVAAQHGVPVIQTLHDYEFMSAASDDHTGGVFDRSDGGWSAKVLNSVLLQAKQRVHVPRVDAWIAISRYLQACYARANIAAHVIPHAIDDSAEEPRGFDERQGVVFAGRLSREKGVADVLLAARQLPDCEFVIAGTGPLANSTATEAGALSNVAYLGHVDSRRVRELLARARVVVIPSHWEEPAGLVALEAMSAGTPVVAYSRGGLRECVADAGAGLVIAGAHELVEAIQSLRNDRVLWERCSKAARVAVQERHSPARYLAQLEAVYSDVLLRRRVR